METLLLRGLSPGLACSSSRDCPRPGRKQNLQGARSLRLIPQLLWDQESVPFPNF